MLLSLEAAPEPAPGGYRCRLCPPAQAILYSDLPAFWESEIFTFFADWLQEILLPAQALMLWRAPDGGYSWAELIQSIDSDGLNRRKQIADLVAILPLPAAGGSREEEGL